MHASKRIQELAADAKGAARLIGVSERLWRRLHAEGKVPRPIRLGKRVLWSVAELERWLAAGGPDRERWERREEVCGSGEGCDG